MEGNTKIGKNAYQNPDGQEYYYPGENRFAEGFSGKQQEILLKLIREGLPAGLIAYPSITSERMECLAGYMTQGMHRAGHEGLTEADLYKCGQLNISLEKTKIIMDTCRCRWHIKPIDELRDVTSLDEEALSYICEAAWFSVDLCKDADRLSISDFKAYAKNRLIKMKKKLDTENFLYKLRFDLP